MECVSRWGEGREGLAGVVSSTSGVSVMCVCEGLVLDDVAAGPSERQAGMQPGVVWGVI